MTTWNERLAAAMTEKGVSIADIAHAGGAAHTSAMAWIGGSGSIVAANDIGARRLLRVCDFLGVRAEWVMFGKLPMRPSQEWPFATPRDAFERIPPPARGLVDRILFSLVEYFAASPQGDSSGVG